MPRTATEQNKRDLINNIASAEASLKRGISASIVHRQAKTLDETLNSYHRWDFERFLFSSNIPSSDSLRQRINAVFAATRPGATQAQIESAAYVGAQAQASTGDPLQAISRAAEPYATAATQSVVDVATGDPFRSAREQKMTAQGIARNVGYALTGKSELAKPVSKPDDWGAKCGFDFTCHWNEHKWKIIIGTVLVVGGVVAFYGVTSGIGRGLVS